MPADYIFWFKYFTPGHSVQIFSKVVSLRNGWLPDFSISYLVHKEVSATYTYTNYLFPSVQEQIRVFSVGLHMLLVALVVPDLVSAN